MATKLLCVFVLLVEFALAAQIDEKLQRGIELSRDKKYEEASSVFREVLETDPANATAHYNLGLALLELDKAAEAIPEFRAAVQSDPPLDKARIGLARAYIKQQDWDQARTVLNEQLGFNARDDDAYYYRGVLENVNRNYAQAVKDLEQAIQLNSRHAYAHYQAGIAYNNLKRPDKMIEHFRAFVNLAPDAPEAEKVRALLRAVR